MFEKMIKKLADTIKLQLFDPATLDDPVALKTSWKPAKRGGAGFRTHILVQIDSHRLEYKISIQALLFYIFLLTISLGGILFFLIRGLLIGDPLVFQRMFFPSLFLGPVLLIGGFGLRSSLTPIVIDKSKNAFWRGRKMPDQQNQAKPSKNFAKLSDVYALQIIGERLKSNSGDGGNHRSRNRFSYEINLVFKDGQRVNVIDYGDLNNIRRDAKTLSSFLSIPVWDSLKKKI